MDQIGFPGRKVLAEREGGKEENRQGIIEQEDEQGAPRRGAGLCTLDFLDSRVNIHSGG